MTLLATASPCQGHLAFTKPILSQAMESRLAIYLRYAMFLATEGLTARSGACTNMRSENGNCGRCGNACAAGTACYNGSCSAI